MSAKFTVLVFLGLMIPGVGSTQLAEDGAFFSGFESATTLSTEHLPGEWHYSDKWLSITAVFYSNGFVEFDTIGQLGSLIGTLEGEGIWITIEQQVNIELFVEKGAAPLNLQILEYTGDTITVIGAGGSGEPITFQRQ